MTDAVESGISMTVAVLEKVGEENPVGAAIGTLKFLALVLGIGPDDSPTPQTIDLKKLVTDISTIRREDVAEQSVRDVMASFMTFSTWVKNNALEVDSGKGTAKQLTDLNNHMKADLQDFLSPNGVLLQGLSKLQYSDHPSEPPYAILGLPAFIFGCGLHLEFLRNQLVSEEGFPNVNSLHATEIANYADGYYKHVKAQKDYMDAQIKNRRNKVGPIFSRRLRDQTHFTGTVRYITFYSYADSAIATDKLPHWPTAIKVNGQPMVVGRLRPHAIFMSENRSEVERSRKEHLRIVENQLRTHLNYDFQRAHNVEVFLANVDKIVKKFR